MSLRSPSATALFRCLLVVCIRRSKTLDIPWYPLLQLNLDLFFVLTRNRLFQLSVDSYRISAPVRPHLFRRSRSTYKLTENHNDIIVSREGVTSKYIGWVVRHVSKHPHLFAVLRPDLTVSGPNKSKPVKVNGGWYASCLVLGSDLINCSKRLSYILRHLVQLLIVLFTRPLLPMFQNILRSYHNVCPLPLWAADSW